MRRRLLTCGVALLVVLAWTAPAFAGGWATATLDSEPGEIQAGETTQIGFVLLQHGQTPVTSGVTYLTATNQETGESIRFDARPEGDAGHWVVDVTLPNAGMWELDISTDGLDVMSVFKPLTVIEGAGVSANNPVNAAQLEAAIADARASISKELREEFGKQLSGMSVEIDGLQKQVADLTVERDTLQKQLADVQTAQTSPQSASNSSVAWWVAALAAAAATAVLAGAALAILLRRGTLARLVLAPQPQ